MEKRIKICGMRQRDNIVQVRQLKPDYLGYIFYPKSARYVDESDIAGIPQTEGIRNTAVFVDPEADQVDRVLASGKFQAVQFHGDEDPAFCRSLRDRGYETIKAFGIDSGFDFSRLEAYLDAVDYFLFDTRSPAYGGTGKSFPWAILDKYPYPKGYFLSGGIGPDNFQKAIQLTDERVYAVDLNSRFEVSPGLKDIQLLESVLIKTSI